jgi:membrane associated rhomboid family serine protease
MYRESFGSSVKRGFNSLPVAIRTIIAINTVVFLVQIISGLFYPPATEFLIKWLRYEPTLSSTLFQPWRVFTYMFVHNPFSIFHYLFNMLWLWWMGRPVEEHMGPRSFTVLYLASGLGGAALDLILGLFLDISPVIGASGAVFGVMVAFAMLYPRMPIMLFLLPPIEARYVVAGFIALNVLFLGGNDNVARLVHLGGALSGYMVMIAYRGGYDLSKIIRFFEAVWKSGRSGKSSPNKNMRIVEDADVVEEVEQSELDRILEKISKHGYDSLTKEEKKKLFDLSKKS